MSDFFFYLAYVLHWLVGIELGMNEYWPINENKCESSCLIHVQSSEICALTSLSERPRSFQRVVVSLEVSFFTFQS